MRENLVEVMMGAAVLVVAAVFVLFASQRTGISGSAGSYELTASFRSVEGVSVGSDVRLAGVKIGAVTSLELNPATFRADARLTVPDGIEIPDDSSILISSEGLLGGNFVEIQPGGSPFNLEPDGEILDTQGAVSLINLLLKFVGGSE